MASSPETRITAIAPAPEAVAKAIGGVFAVLTLAGWVIGSFSILVGGFGIANIMFVSVKERVNIIGIQKSLGAKNYFILFQFLFEAVMLSLARWRFGRGVFGLPAVLCANGEPRRGFINRKHHPGSRHLQRDRRISRHSSRHLSRPP